MTEAVLQADMQREILRDTSTFSSGDVVINDWSILDGPNDNAPYVIIESSDTLGAEIVQQEQVLFSYVIPFTVIVQFTDWDESRAALQTARTTVVNRLTGRTATLQNASGKLDWGLRAIRALEPVSEIYDRYQENPEESLPIFLAHRLGAQVEELV